MSLQDDIFDVEDALVGSKVTEGFERIITTLSTYEQERDGLAEENQILRRAIQIVQSEE